jgi:polysaccharide export outer membrane protein
MRIRLGIVIAVALALVWSADAQQKATAREPFRISPEDMLRISVWKNDEMSGPAVVRPDGMISLPLLQDVQAEGLTPLELQKVLTQKLKEFIPNPEVSVIVTDIRSLRVSVMGEVMRPGRFEIKSRVTVLEALALAGGFTQYATRSKIVILRPDETTMKRIPFNYDKAAAGGTGELLSSRWRHRPRAVTDYRSSREEDQR